jgi:hypothetical protein
MNTEFETKVHEIATELQGSVERGSAVPPETALFLLALPKEDADAHLELGLVEHESGHLVAIRGIFPFHSLHRRDIWPMPYDEVGDVSGAREFLILLPPLASSTRDMVEQIRHLLLPLYLPALVMTRVALAQKSARSRSAVDQMVQACGVKPVASDDRRFAAQIGPDGRMLAFGTVGREGRVKLAIGGLTVEEAVRVLRTAAESK